MMMAQHQTEAHRSPIITSLTTKWACQNNPNRDMSCTTGAAWATSAGFIIPRPRSSEQPWSRKAHRRMVLRKILLSYHCSFAPESVENKGGSGIRREIGPYRCLLGTE